MNKEIRDTVFNARPEFKEVIKKYGAFRLADYFNDIFKKSIAPEFGRFNELWSVLERKIQFLPVVERELIRETLASNGFVSTAEHDGPIGSPFFLSAQLLRAQANPVVIVFPFGSISPENSSFPRGLVVHDDKLYEKKLHIISRKYRHTPILLQPPYALQDCKRVFREISHSALSATQKKSLQDVFSHVYTNQEIISLPSYEEQLMHTNYALCKLIPGMENTSYISVCIESLVLNLVEEFHLDKKTPIGNLFHDENAQMIFKKEFADVSTDIFWGIRNNQRIQLFFNNGTLVDADGEIFLVLNSEDVRTKIHKSALIPSTPLCFMLLLYYGLTCVGGFSQVGYLPKIKQRCQSFFNKTGYEKESIAIEPIAADIFFSDFSFLTVSVADTTVPATLLDLCLNRGMSTISQIRDNPKNITLSEATDCLMPLFYTIVVKQKK